MLHACSSCAKLKNLHGRTPESDGPFACSICGKRSADVALWSRFGMEKALSIFLSVLVIITVFSLVIWSMYSVAAEKDRNRNEAFRRQATIPNVLAIKQVRHMNIGDVAWVCESTVWVDNSSKVWITNDAVISNKKPEAGNPVKISFLEKGFALEVSSLSKWKAGEYSSLLNKSYPVVEIKIYEHDK